MVKHHFSLYLMISLLSGPLAFQPSSAQKINRKDVDSLKREFLIQSGDELGQTLFYLSHAFRSESDSALHYADKLLSFGKGNGYWMGMALYLKANVSLMNGGYDSCIHYARRSVMLLEEVDSIKSTLPVRECLANAYTNLGWYEKGVAEHLNAAHIADSLNLPIEEALSLGLVGDIYRQQKDSTLAVKHLKDAYAVVMENEEGKWLRPMITHNLALAYDLADKQEMAIELFKRLFTDYSDRLRPRDSSRIFTNIARSYLRLDVYDSARKYLNAGKKIREQLDDPKHNAYAYKEYASLYNETGEYEKSVVYATKVLEVGEELGKLDHLLDGYRNLRNAHNALGHFKESAEYGEKYSDIIEDIYQKEKQELIVEMDTKYQTAQKEKEIEQLESQKLIDQKAKIILVGGIASIVSTACLIIFLLRIAFQKQKNEKQLAIAQILLNKKELESKKQELAHFVVILREKNKILEELESQQTGNSVDEVEKFGNIDKLIKLIILTEEDWKVFKKIFEEVHTNFFAKLKSSQPDLTKGEIRLAALMKLNLSTTEMSKMLGVSPDSVTKTKYRVKKKLELEKGRELEDFVRSI